MVVYHGTTLEITHPQILTSEIGRDFGFAFYTTDIREQAERWAIRRAKIQSRKEKRPVPAIVNEYEWNRSDDLEIMEFSGASMEWLDMVVQCRSNPTYRHSYDIVTGKIANDNVGETVSFVIQGIMRKEDAIERLKFEKSTIRSRSAQRRHSHKFILSEAIPWRDNHGSRNNQSNISSGNRKADFGKISDTRNGRARSVLHLRHRSQLC